MGQQLMIWRRRDALDHPSASHVLGSPDPARVSFADHASTQMHTHVSRENIILFNQEQISAACLQIYELNKPSVLSGFFQNKEERKFCGDSRTQAALL